ncbi:MAG: GntR family transcriptional regulator [Actinomycetota bacterium]|nr:GntR family transcriptional regulator [Actinomycetota bacterium]
MTVDEILAATANPPATSLAEQAYQYIRERLVMLDIRPGAPINDGQIAEAIGMGRTPVREAIKRLEADHLVHSFPRRGTFATTIDATELSAIAEIRRQLAPYASRTAAERASAPQREQMRALAARIGEGRLGDGDRVDLMRVDRAAHGLIYRSSGNAHLEDILIRYDNLAIRIWWMVIDRLPDLAHHVVEQAQLLNAVADGDGDRAEKLTLEHISGFESEIRQVL